MCDPEDKLGTDIAIVKWADGTHEIYHYNDDIGVGLTRCGSVIGPGDVELEGSVTCIKCRRAMVKEKYPKNGPLDWFPESPDHVSGER